MIDSVVLVLAVVYVYLMARCIFAQRRGTLESLTIAHYCAMIGALLEFVIGGLRWAQGEWSGLAIAAINAGMAIVIAILIGRQLDRMEQKEVQRFLDL